MITHPVSDKLWRSVVVILISLSGALTALCKNVDDVVVMKNGDRLTGEIRELQSGELRIKPGYMAISAQLDWSRVDQIDSKTTFFIYLVSGKLFTSVMRLLPSNTNDVANFVIGEGDQAVRVHQYEVIRILPVETGVLKRLEGSVDLGVSYTSGNDQYQTDLSGTATYRKGDHSYTAAISSSFSGQPKGESSKRNQFTFDYRKQLTRRYFAAGILDLLQSDQQSLSLRTSVGGALGRNIKQTERTRLSAYGGVAVTRENYSALLGQPRSTNAEALTGLDLASFRFSKTDIRSRFTLFPSLTTPGRMRMQATADIRFKIVRDLWWGFHLYENYDSKPPVRADKNDLGVSSSLGWKF